MALEITKTNKIKQELQFNLDEGSDENKRFIALLTEFIETESKQTIEGTIDRLDICIGNYDKDIKMNITTLKEDKLKLIEHQ